MSNTSRFIGLASILAVSAAIAADFPAATYKAPNMPYTVSFDGQGRFHVDQGQTQQVEGSYKIKADEIQLTDASGPWACTTSGEQTGTYRWKLNGSALSLNLVSDKCKARVQSLVNLKWQRQ